MVFNGIYDKKTIFLYVKKRTPRISYTMDFVFRCVLGLELFIIHDKNEFLSSSAMRINYSSDVFEERDILSFCPQGILTEDIIRNFNTKITEKEHLPYLILDSPSEFDPFAIIFYLISRYEEYHTTKRDEHDRFPASQSCLYSSGLLGFPVVDAWINWLRIQLNALHAADIQRPPFSFVPTYDIDHVRAFLWKGWKRSIAATGKELIRLEGNRLRKRWNVVRKKEKDPFDMFGIWEAWHKEQKVAPIFFWLLGDFGEYDKNPSSNHPNFIRQIQDNAAVYDVGIHPSHASHLHPTQVGKEISRLEDIIQNNVTKNRFHYLRFRLPESYRILIQLDIKEDYSMAYPECLGFRAGTSHSFFWYDLEREEKTGLKIHPFQIMDVTLKNYLALSPEEALEKASFILGNIKKYGGTFMSLWHNNSFELPAWEGWEHVYKGIYNRAKNEI